MLALRAVAILLTAIALVGSACDPQAAPSATVEEVARSESSSASASPAERLADTLPPTPTAEADESHFMAAIVADEPLVLRSEPGTDADSEVLPDLLHPGMRVQVESGPVAASGYDWYFVRVGALSGWAAANSRSADPWLRAVSNGLIAFGAPGGSTGIGQPHIDQPHVMNADGTEIRLLAELPGPEVPSGQRPSVMLASFDTDAAPDSPAGSPVCGMSMTPPEWAPTGRELLVGRECVAVRTYLLSRESAEPALVVDGREPAWAPDAHRFVIAPNVPWCADPTCAAADPSAGAQGPWELSIIDRAGQHVPLGGTAPLAAGAQPSWSPDGSQVAFVGSTPGDPAAPYVFVVSADRTAPPTPLTPGTRPLWSPDGSRILVERWLDDRAATLFLVDPTTGADLADLGRGSSAEWSPDGGSIAYIRNDDESEGGAFVMSAHGTAKHRIIAGAVSVAWSPDGRRLLLERYEETNRSGIYSSVIYVVDPDGSALTRLADGRMPAWEPEFGPIP